MEIEVFANNLKEILKRDLPGESSHHKMMSYKRKSVNEVVHKNNYRESAVLILFYPFNQELYLSFMLRPTYDGVHSGQVCFPGGRKEKVDENLLQTALREAQEEMNIRTKDVKIIGELSRIFVPPSNFLIQPIVGYCTTRPDFIAEEKEVEAIIEVPVKEFQRYDSIQKAKVTIQNNVELEVPGFYYKEHLIWGATSMILMELLDVLEEMK